MQDWINILKRVGMAGLVLLVLIRAAPARCAPPLRSLAEFENRAQDSPKVLAAAAALDESLARLDLTRSDGGWRIFGGIGAGHFRDQALHR